MFSQVLPESFALLKQETTIGRDPASDVHLSWDGMSRNHARIIGAGGDINMKSPAGTPIPSSFKICDGGGVNGTYLNGVRVSFCSSGLLICLGILKLWPFAIQVDEGILRDGDVIGFGRGRWSRLPENETHNNAVEHERQRTERGERFG